MYHVFSCYYTLSTGTYLKSQQKVQQIFFQIFGRQNEFETCKYLIYYMLKTMGPLVRGIHRYEEMRLLPSGKFFQ